MAPPRSPNDSSDGEGKTRRLSEAVCLLDETEKLQRMKLLTKSDDFVVLGDGRVFKVAQVSEGTVSIFDQYFYFCPAIIFSTRISIFDQNFDF